MQFAAPTYHKHELVCPRTSELLMHCNDPPFSLHPQEVIVATPIPVAHKTYQ